jgi:hypothetical protein
VSLAELEDLERAYGRLFAALEAEQGDGPGGCEPRALAAGWAACLRAFERLHAATADAPAPSEDVRAALVRVRRLHAVVSSFAVRSRDAVESELARVTAVRGRLPGRPGERQGGRTGLSCDVRG